MQKTADCIFIFPPGKESGNKCFDYHLGSAYIISYLKSNCFQAEQYIRGYPADLNTCTKEILDRGPRIAGFTVYDSNFNISVLIAERIRKLSPGVLIVFGGPCPTVNFDFIMSRYSFVDACFINQGEENFLGYLTKLSEANYNYEKADLSGIEGICYRQAAEVHSNPVSRILKASSGCSYYLDKYPSPYLNETIPPEEGYNTGILTARGCNQNCIYCNCAVLSNRKFLTHSVDRVIGELDLISGYMTGHQVLTFQDDTFSLIPDRALTICNKIIENRIKARLACITRIDRVNEILLDRMKEAGFVKIVFSLESANPVTLRRIGKIHVAEDIPSYSLQKETAFIENLERMTAYAKKIGMENVTVSIMLGLPDETLNEAEHTIETIENNTNIDGYAHNFLKIFRGTPLFTIYEKYGYKLRYISNNPVYPKVTHPVDVVRKVRISLKSNLHQQKKVNDKSTLNIMSLTSGQNNLAQGIRNIILQSDHVSGRFVNWLKEILALNGTIIQIYSSESSMIRLAGKNHEKFIRYSSPSLNIRNYFLRKAGNSLLLLSSESLFLKLENEKENIRICDFKYFESNLNNSVFLKTLCRESDSQDSMLAFSFLERLSREKNPFSFLTGINILPYFANMCKWTLNVANCVSMNTLFINEENEIRFCWHGAKTGMVGQSIHDLNKNLSEIKNQTMANRKCHQCNVSGKCVKCTAPFPLSETQYCINIKSADVGGVTELMTGLDQIKQLLV